VYKRHLSLVLLLLSVAVFVALPASAVAHDAPRAQATVHRIAWGDTLTSIARLNQTTVATLKTLNNLRGDRIIAGRSLRLSGQVLASRGMVLSASERSALAKLIHAEAQGEPFKGQVAVAAVVFNRIRDPRFPNTLRGVMYQPFQFEPILNGWAYKPAGPAAYRALDAALAGQDPTNGAVFFYNPVKAPNRWMATRPVVTRIGNHVFMK